MAAPDLDDPPPSEPAPRRPAGPLRSSTFGEVSPQATQQAGNMSPRQESRREEMAPDKLELGFNAGTIVAVAVALSPWSPSLTFIILGVYTCASLRRRLGSIGSNNDNNNDDRSVGVTAGSRDHDVEVQAHATLQREQLLHKEDKEQWSAHQKGEWWPLGEEMGEDGDEYEDEDGYEDEDEDGDEEEAGRGGRGEASAAETGTARVAHLVAPGAVSMVDIRRRTPPSLPSSRTVRDISSLPDLAWAQSLTTGGGRAVTSAASAADLVGPGVVAAGASRGVSDGAMKKETASSSSPPSSSSSSKRKGFRKMVGRKNKVKEWCERGMGMGLGTGGFGPYAGMY